MPVEICELCLSRRITDAFTLTVSLLLLISVHSSIAGPACRDGSNKGIDEHKNIATCPGQWSGHISNSSHLCASGWKVCSHEDYNILRKVRWEQAVSVEGCYGINAAHDGGRCRECRDDLNQDDLAGIGRGCSHQNFGQTSCISGGRIDASCCVDSHFRKACHHQPGIITGVVCCKISVKKPRIVVKPKDKLEVSTGHIFLLTCQVSSSPQPRVQWYKDGIQLQQSKRIQALPSGDLLVSLARKSDSGLYSCEVINEAGMDMASSQVIVEDHNSGCRDGTTEGMKIHKDLHACAGRWEGHVRKARTLCRKGWRVCNPKDKESIQRLTWLDIFDLDGCYAYNAASRKGKCRRCTRGPMAGVGRNCGRMKYSKSSCLAQGRVDVFKSKDRNEGCRYKEGVTTGVLCCRKNIPLSKNKQSSSTCTLKCQNGGTCISRNLCKCAPGFKGALCQNPICKKGCGKYATCIKPGKCRCKKGYFGKYCRRKIKHRCQQLCLNGGRCWQGGCKCPPLYGGKSCQYLLGNSVLTNLNRTER